MKINRWSRTEIWRLFTAQEHSTSWSINCFMLVDIKLLFQRPRRNLQTSDCNSANLRPVPVTLPTAYMLVNSNQINCHFSISATQFQHELNIDVRNTSGSSCNSTVAVHSIAVHEICQCCLVSRGPTVGWLRHSKSHESLVLLLV
jgi:hypothetical protein